MADTFCLRNSRGAQRFVGFLFLTVLFGRWLAGLANSDHVGCFSPTFFWHLTCFWLWLLAVFIFYFDTLFLVMEFVCLVEEMQFMLISRCRAHFTTPREITIISRDSTVTQVRLNNNNNTNKKLSRIFFVCLFYCRCCCCCVFARASYPFLNQKLYKELLATRYN